jgi:transcriptional regulator with XRE-family HTH domain
VEKKETASFAETLKSLRESRGMTQQQLATVTSMNVFGVAKLEQGLTSPTWKTVMKLAKALGVDCTAFANCSDLMTDELEPVKPAAKKPPAKKGKK